jgi:hypothetical protein
MQTQSKPWILCTAAVAAALFALGIVVALANPSESAAPAARAQNVATKTDDAARRNARLGTPVAQTGALLAEITETSLAGPGYAIGGAVIGIVALFALNMYALAAWDRRRARGPQDDARAKLDALIAERDALEAAIIEATRASNSIASGSGVHAVGTVERRRTQRRRTDRERYSNAA